MRRPAAGAGVNREQIIQANAQREQQQFDRAQDALQKAMNSILTAQIGR